MDRAWWSERRWVAFAAYVTAVFVTVPFANQVVLALRNTDMLGATVTGSYAAVVAALLCVVTVLLLGLSIPEERVHFLQYGSMALLARSALSRGADAHATRSLLLALALTVTLGLLEEC